MISVERAGGGRVGVLDDLRGAGGWGEGSAYLMISVERAGGGRVGVLDDLRGAGGWGEGRRT